jgi:hypothetical protein
MLSPTGGYRGKQALVVEVADGQGAERLRGLEVPVQGSVSGEVLRTGKTVVVADGTADERVFRPVAEVGGLGPAMSCRCGLRGSPSAR